MINILLISSFIKIDFDSSILRTKIVCTIGPASYSKEMLGKMIEAGMSVARINMSHANHEFVRQVVADVRQYVAERPTQVEVGIWMDINGPKIRSGKLKDGLNQIHLVAGQEFYFYNDPSILGDENGVSTTYTKPVLKAGDRIYIDDGLLSFTVIDRVDSINGIKCRVDNTGYLGASKGITFPSFVFDELPAISDRDHEDIKLALELDLDLISVSCIRNIDDVEELRFSLGNNKMKLLAKIENKHGADNFDSILRMADGIVIDRGYLGTEIDISQVTIAQKQMISKANITGKPVLVANQMLESMRENPRPTRSEASDVANAVMDGVDGLVLSGETAIGEYVLESIKQLRALCQTAEVNTNYVDHQLRVMRLVPKPVPVSESIASSAAVAARQVGAKVIIATTEYGGTARLVAKYRASIPVVAATLIERTARQLNVSFGLVPYYHNGKKEDLIKSTLRYAVSIGLCKPGDISVVTSGQSIGFLEGTTTKMQIVTVPEFK